MRDKKLIVGCMLILIAGILICFQKNEMVGGYFSNLKLQVLAKTLREDYLYDLEESQEEDLYYGYVGALDNAKTYYLSEEELEYAQLTAQGDSFGVGVELKWSVDEQYLLVTKVLPNSSAEKAGILVGDHIIKINGIETVSKNSTEVLDLISSLSEVAIDYEVQRGSKKFNAPLIPTVIIQEPFSAEMIEGVLYVDIHAIKEGMSSQLEKAIYENVSSCKGVILDLRDVNTDNVEEVRKISDLFLEDTVAFEVESKVDGYQTYTTEAGAYDISLVVITNGATQSGAEALVLALKDRAIQLGGITAGNAYLKTIVPLSDGSGISVASGVINDRYGEALSKAGIVPEVRLYISDKEQLILLEKGYITQDEDSYLQAALKLFA